MQEKNKMPFGKLFISTFKSMMKFTDAWHIWLSYAFILTLLSLVCGRWSYSCQFETKGFWCPQTDTSSITGLFLFKIVLYYLLMLFLLMSYICDFYDTAYKGKKFNIREIIQFSKVKIKAVGVLFAILVYLIFSIVAAYFIIRKPANPNWLIELMYFLMLYMILGVSLLMMRLSVGLSYYLQDNHWPNWKEIYAKTVGKSYVPIVMMLVLMLFCVVLNLQTGVYLSHLNVKYYSFVTAFFTELMAYAVILLSLTMPILMFRVQHEMLENWNVSRETTTPAPAPESEQVVAEKTKDRQSAAHSKGKKQKTASAKSKKTAEKQLKRKTSKKQKDIKS